MTDKKQPEKQAKSDKTPRLSEIEARYPKRLMIGAQIEVVERRDLEALFEIARALEADLAAANEDNARLTRELAETTKSADKWFERAREAQNERDAARAKSSEWMGKFCKADNEARKARAEADALRAALKNMKAFGTTANHLWFEARIDEALAPRRRDEPKRPKLHTPEDLADRIARTQGTAKAESPASDTGVSRSDDGAPAAAKPGACQGRPKTFGASGRSLVVMAHCAACQYPECRPCRNAEHCPACPSRGSSA